MKYKILTEPNLNKYLSIDEGIEYKLIKEINNASSVEELIMKVKSKRYTYNRIRRMLIHILIGLTKEDKNQIDLEYIKVLGLIKRSRVFKNTKRIRLYLLPEKYLLNIWLKDMN